MRTKRGRRRHDAQRVYARRVAYFKALGIPERHSYQSTGTPCSCWKCRNPRRTPWAAKTRQELISELSFVEQLQEVSHGW
jgi:hypothetical protein